MSHADAMLSGRIVPRWCRQGYWNDSGTELRNEHGRVIYSVSPPRTILLNPGRKCRIESDNAVATEERKSVEIAGPRNDDGKLVRVSRMLDCASQEQAQPADGTINAAPQDGRVLNPPPPPEPLPPAAAAPSRRTGVYRERIIPKLADKFLVLQALKKHTTQYAVWKRTDLPYERVLVALEVLLRDGLVRRDANECWSLA